MSMFVKHAILRQCDAVYNRSPATVEQCNKWHDHFLVHHSYFHMMVLVLFCLFVFCFCFFWVVVVVVVVFFLEG